ncbi:hypothetical protein HMPREF1555_02346 [Porphyromonas gingivalis F0570]|uniref:Uncharacterized protein n=1 Tax=Porphyromonas gingivalis F0570 TaxID=1227271 RepID=A0A0E2LMT4_PORGN|nr:hypothetical protein HMPREF1555_02346 [Porphyromonas gingivalis F0570]
MLRNAGEVFSCHFLDYYDLGEQKEAVAILRCQENGLPRRANYFT